MKILPIYTEALQGFGYTEEEARFLYLVVTHSGYFTCQQFLQFIKTKPGKRSVAFARKVVEKKHASTKEYLRHGRVFHLFSRNLYDVSASLKRIHFRRFGVGHLGRRRVRNTPVRWLLHTSKQS